MSAQAWYCLQPHLPDLLLSPVAAPLERSVSRPYPVVERQAVKRLLVPLVYSDPIFGLLEGTSA
jgi:hypothetical protein